MGQQPLFGVQAALSDEDGTGAIAIGADGSDPGIRGAEATAANGVAIGTDATVTAVGAVALGASSVADVANTVSVLVHGLGRV